MQNRDKMKAKSFIKHLATLFFVPLVLFVVGCSNERENSQIVDEREPVVLGVDFSNASSSQLEGSEGKTERVRIVIFDMKDVIVHNQLYESSYLATNDNRVVIDDFLTGRYSFYLFTNEPKEEKLEYDAISSPKDIRAFRTVIKYGKNNLPEEFPSYAYFSHAVTLEDSEVKFLTTILMAKVSVKLKVDRNKFDGGRYPVINSVRVVSLPHHSWVTPQQYVVKNPETELTASPLHPVQLLTPEDINEDVYSCTLYIPEYLVAALDAERVALVVYGERRGGTGLG